MPKTSDSQVDIAGDVQRRLHQEHETRHEGDEDAHPRDTVPDNAEFKATQFDGNPNPTPAKGGGVLHPKDDTPAKLETREGPRDDQK